MMRTILIIDMIIIGVAAILQTRNMIRYKKSNGAMKTRITFMIMWFAFFAHCKTVLDGSVNGIYFTIAILALLSLYFRVHHEN